ncbi:MAG: YciI family protein, partial [Nitratireductor sp.]
DAIEWAKRCPGSPNETIEIRKIQQMEDYSDEVQEIVKTYPDVLEKGINRS